MVVTLVDSLHLQWASLHQRKGYVEFTPEDAKIAASTTCILNSTCRALPFHKEESNYCAQFYVA